MRGICTTVPLAYRGPPSEVNCVDPRTSICWRANFQPMTSETASTDGLDGRGRGEVTEHHHAGAVRVEALGVAADDVLGDAAGARFPDAPEAIDGEVVGDVVPAVGVHVVALDAAQEGGDVLAAVRVRVHRVVDDSDLEVGCVHRRNRGLASAPCRAAEDRRRRARAAGALAEAAATSSPRSTSIDCDGGPHEVDLDRGHGGGHAELVGVGAAEPDRIAGEAGRLVGACGALATLGAVVGVDLDGQPRRPRPSTRARASRCSAGGLLSGTVTPSRSKRVHLLGSQPATGLGELGGQVLARDRARHDGARRPGRRDERGRAGVDSRRLGGHQTRRGRHHEDPCEQGQHQKLEPRPPAPALFGGRAGSCASRVPQGYDSATTSDQYRPRERRPGGTHIEDAVATSARKRRVDQWFR